jgi:hypothetical protein
MKRKAIFLLTAMLFLNVVAFSQNKKPVPDSRLKEIYSARQIDDLLAISPEKIEYYNFFLNNYCTVEQIEPIDGLLMGDINTIKTKEGILSNLDASSFDIKTFNMLKYYIPLNLDKKIYYKIGDTNTFLVFISITEFTKKSKTQK